MNKVPGLTLCGFLAVAFTGPAISGPVTITNTFSNGTVADADQVNQNFLDVKTAVDDNDARITANTTGIAAKQDQLKDSVCTTGQVVQSIAADGTVSCTSVPVVPPTRTISFPARIIAFDPAGTTVTADSQGLRWLATFSGGGQVYMQAPDDYAGGDVSFTIFFDTTTATVGIVDFFIRPTSFDPGEGRFDPGSVSADAAVPVSGTIGFGTVYRQDFTIPAVRMQKEWWTTTIQRDGNAATYPDPVRVLAIAFTYPTL